MDHIVLKSFGGELTKTAISARLALAAIKRRAAQGARVAPKLMQRAEAAAAKGLTSTPAAVRRTALGAAEGGRAAQAAKTLAARSGVAPQRAALQARGAQLEGALRKAPGSVTSPVQGGAVLERGYSPAAAEFMAGKGTLAQAQAATRARPTVLTPRGAVGGIPVGAGGGTAAAKPQALRAAAAPQGATAVAKRGIGPLGTANTQIARPPAMAQTGRTLSGPGMAYEKTMLRPMPGVTMGGRRLGAA